MPSGTNPQPPGPKGGGRKASESPTSGCRNLDTWETAAACAARDGTGRAPASVGHQPWALAAASITGASSCHGGSR